jgi:hypothetical protein
MQNINIELQQKNIGSITHTKKIENNSKLEAHLYGSPLQDIVLILDPTRIKKN